MKKSILSLFALLLSFLIIGNSFASDAPLGLQVESQTENSFTISWDSVEDAFGYYISYGTTSGDYETEIVDLIEDITSYTISGIDMTQDYYVVVKSVDMTTAEESGNSEELIVKTGDQGESKDFKLLEVDTIYTNQLILKFSVDLDDSEDVVREFKIVNTNNEFEEVAIESAELLDDEKNELLLTLVGEVSNDQEYTLTVISLNDIYGNSIESGVDGQEIFYVSPDVTKYTEALVNDDNIQVSIGDDSTIDYQGDSNSAEYNSDNENIDYNSAEEGGDSATESNVEEGGEKLAGATLSDGELGQTTLSAAAEQDTLPQTGPEHVLIFILTIVLGTLVFVLKYKKV